MSEARRVHEVLARRAAAAPRAPALIDGRTGAVITWAELEERALGLAARLEAVGVGRGDRVAIVTGAAPPVASALHACLAVGAALVPHSPRAPEAERRLQLEGSGARVHLTAGGELMVDRSEGLRPVARPAGQAIDPDVAVVLTSGSAGEPKGVRLTQGNCLASARGCADALGGVGPEDRWLSLLGAHRVGGLAIFWRSLLSGAALVHVARFEEAAAEAALERGPTLTSMVPAMLRRLVDAGLAPELSRLRAILVGGAPATQADVLGWADLGLPVCPSYGMTETGSQVAVVPPGRTRELAGAAGLVHAGAVVEFEGGAAAGEILVGGAVLSPGYLDPRLDAGVFQGRGPARRMRTGDLGRMDGGVLTVTGRRDRMIITAGEKVQPQEVEAVLTQHPGVRDAAVCGTPDERYGSVVTALVAGEADAASLREWCALRLSSYKVPRRFVMVDSIPRGEDGKLLAHRIGG